MTHTSTDFQKLLSEAKRHINVLCSEILDRSVGSEGNRKATTYFKQVLLKNNWETEETPLDVMDWNTKGASLTSGQNSFEVFSSPYSTGCALSGELVAVSNFSELKNKDLNNRIVLLHGDIAKEQIMPKNFVFYNPEEHQQIISLLEQSGASALICATGRNSVLAGGVYPFPMFEDGDFNIPSVYMKDTEGEKLHEEVGKIVRLESVAERISEKAFNVLGIKNREYSQRIVITAHIDAKKGTPGAIDNATGVTVLLLLSDLLKNLNSKHRIELVAFNGEDYYAVPGQMKYIEQNHNNFPDILLNINIDGAGYKEGKSAFSMFELPDHLSMNLQKVIESHPEIEEGLPWVQGDHSIFLQYGRPAVAVSSSWFIENMDTQDITHTPKDHPEIINFDRLVEIALSIHEFIE